MLDRRTLLDIAPLFCNRRTTFFVREALRTYEDNLLLYRWLDDLDRRLNTVGEDVSVREIHALESLRYNGDWRPVAGALDVLNALTGPQAITA